MGYQLIMDGRFETAEDEAAFIEELGELLEGYGDNISTVHLNTDFNGAPVLKAPVETQATPEPITDPTTARLNSLEAKIGRIADALGQTEPRAAEPTTPGGYPPGDPRAVNPDPHRFGAPEPVEPVTPTPSGDAGSSSTTPAAPAPPFVPGETVPPWATPPASTQE